MSKPPQPTVPLDPAIVEFLDKTGLAKNGEFEAEPLTGGVASDIWKIRTSSSVFVVKKALSRLRVAQEWNAPVSRNASEVEWLIQAGKAAHGAVPEVLAHDAGRGVFAMSFLDPVDHPVWKNELRRGKVEPHFASQLGQTIARIHSATANSNDVARRFDNDEIFYSIRISRQLQGCIQTLRISFFRSQETRSDKNVRWCTAISAQRTFSLAAMGPSSSMPSAPGMENRPSNWRSASIIFC